MILKQSLFKFVKTGAIPWLMVIVAFRQIVLVHTAGLSPWHGGGFGMFASIDRDERRLVTARASSCREHREFIVSEIVTASPQLLSIDTYTHASTFPTTAQLQKVGKTLLSTNSQNPIAELYDASEGDERCPPTVELQVWRLFYDGQSIDYEPVTSVVEVQP